ncbi:MAG: hypothetical protein WAV26_05525 [Candidatus Deferrimicrobium sp.]
MSKRTLVLMCSIFLVVPLLFMGCGDDGSDGAQGVQGIPGPQGETGATGPAGPVTNTNESCMVCHTTGRIADISDSNPASITHYNANYEKPFITVSDNIIVSNVGGKPKVAFHVQFASDNTPVQSIVSGYPRFIIADLVPAGTATAQGTWSTPMFEQWASETATGSSATVGGVWDASDAANGNYAYTFARGFADAATATTPDNVTILAPQFDNTHIQRILVRISGGTPVNNVVGTTTSNAVGVVDFNIPASGASTTGLGYNERQFVTVQACQKCHGPNVQGMAHGGAGNGYVDTRACVLCHTPIGGFAATTVEDGIVVMTQDEGQAWFASLIHKIHSAIAMPIFPTRLGGVGYGKLTYPQDVRDCETCHTASGKNLGAGDNTANWKTHPTANVCGTCHTSANFVTGVGHAGGSQPDTACQFCHPATGHVADGLGASVTEAHDTSPTAVLHPKPKNVPEFGVTITMSPAQPFYVAGDNVTITVTLVKTSDNTAVPGTVYTAAKDSVGTSGGGLSTANLQVYGPRALPKPIFAPTDNNQSHVLLLGTTTVDKSGTVATDNTGFKYQFTVPAGLANGTYMTRFEGQDYGSVTDNDYVTSSTAFINFQVGNATVTKKVAGDICTNCHGATRMHLEGLHPHNAPFDTDACIACHDYSGGYAATLSNRVHAVHAASENGDMKNLWDPITASIVTPLARDWSDVTYPLGVGWPGGIGRCDICHASGNTSYRSTIHEVACLGCHGDRPAAIDHMLQSGGDYPKNK